MKFARFILAIICFGLSLSGPAQAQVSFYQPLTFPDGSGPLFVADFNGDGKKDILCSYACLNLGNGDGTFKSVTPPSGSVLAVADFNGDGKADLLEETTNSQTFSVLLGNGDGTFQAPIITPTGGYLGLMAVGDLNGDGYADVLGGYGPVLYVFLSNGDGTFKAGIPNNLGVSNLSGTISIADVNGNGELDVVYNAFAYTSSGIQQELLVLLGNGDGTLKAPIVSAGLPPYYTATGTVVGDFNGDGKPDLISTASFTSSVTYLFLGNGDGTFQSPTSVFVPNGAQIAAADVNGDGKLDLVSAAVSSISQIYLGNGDGTFTAPKSYVSSFPSGNSIYSESSVVIADFNGDGKLDIASSGGILLGNGDGTFQGIPITTLTYTPYSATIGDFENSGKPDVAVVGAPQNDVPPFDLFILHNNGDGSLSLLHTYSLAQLVSQILVGDLNGDGNLDLVVTDGGLSDGYNVLLGNGDGSFQAPVVYSQNVSFGAATLVDVSNDKKLDLVQGGTNAPVGVSLGNGDGTFAATVAYDDLGPWGSTLITGDFNGDGKVDIGVSPPYMASGTVMLYGNGDGTFQAPIIPVNLNGYTATSTADFRNSGRTDLFNGSQVGLNNGDGSFTFLPSLKYGGFPVTDINGDGKIDLLVNNIQQQGQTGCQSGVELGNGDGTFGPLMNVPASGCYPFTNLVADMNGDGKPDVVFLWGPGVGVLLNTTQPVVPDFSITSASGSSSSQTINAGETASFSLAFAPTGLFTGTISLSCAITPVATPAPTCGLSTSSVQIIGNGTQTVTVKVGTTAPVTAQLFPHFTLPTGLIPISWVLVFLGSVWLWAGGRERGTRFAAPVVTLFFLLSLGCGGSGSSSTHTTPGTPAGTYTATVTATSGSTSHNIALQVIVQ